MARYKLPLILSWIVRLLASMLVAVVCGTVLWRVFFSTAIPRSMKSLVPNERLAAAYEQYGDALTLCHQDLASITKATGNYGYFSVEEVVFIPEAEQVQILFRYNNSTIRHLAEDYGLSAIPDKSSHLFDVSLVRTTDLTPDDKTDNLDASTLSKSRILPAYEPTRDETSLYTYYRYVFNGVTVEDVTDAIYIDVYYVNDIAYDATAYGTLCIYAWDEKWLPFSPSAADKKAIAGATS